MIVDVCFGANGVVGTKFVEYILNNSSHEVIGFDIQKNPNTINPRYTFISIDLLRLKPGTIIEVLENKNIGRILFAVGYYGINSFPFHYKINAKTAKIVLEELFWGEIQFSKLFVLSSSAVYGEVKSSDLPISEDYEICPVSDYGKSKFVLEDICLYYTDRLKGDLIIIRPSNFVAKFNDDRLLIGKLVNQINKRHNDHEIRLTLFNKTGERDWISLSYFIHLLIELGKIDRVTPILNIGSGYSLSVEDLTEIISKVINKPIVIETTDVEPLEEYKSNYLNVSRFLELLSLDPRDYQSITKNELEKEFEEIFDD